MFDKDLAPETVTLPKGHRARRRKAEDLRAAYDLHRNIADFAFRGDQKAKQEHVPGQRKLFEVEELVERKGWLSDLTGDSQKALHKALEKLEEKGPWRFVAKAPAPAVLDSLNQDFPNFLAVTRLIQQRLLLCRLASNKEISLPPILLNGPPGVGKTAYCQRLAGLLGLRFEKADLSSAAPSFALTGLDSGYSTGTPGKIWESLQHDTLSVLWLLDEIDKVKQDHKDGGSAHLLGLLEPVSSRRFVDNCALIPIDASWLCYIATSNELDHVDAPLLSRFEVFEIQAPHAEQLQAIVRSIYRSIQEAEPWGPIFDSEPSDAVVQALIGLTPREIRRHLLGAFAVAAGDSRNILLATDVDANPRPALYPIRRIGFI